MLRSRPSEHCFENCKPFELKLKEELCISKKLKLADLLNVKLLKIRTNIITKCVKK